MPGLVRAASTTDGEGMSAIPVCCALIEHEQRVLIAQRPLDKHLAGAWEFPGGKIESDESPEIALRREIQEELGCILGDLRALPPVEHDYGTTRIRLHPFVAALTPDSPAPRAIEHIALRWLTRAEISTTPLAPADIPVLESYLQSSA
jgi:8-oxo-dGTP diphosphatase